MAQRRQTGKQRPPDREPVLRETWLAVSSSLGARDLVIGGKSMGGRIASLVADEAGLVCLLAQRQPRLGRSVLAWLRSPFWRLTGSAALLPRWFGRPGRVPGGRFRVGRGALGAARVAAQCRLRPVLSVPSGWQTRTAPRRAPSPFEDGAADRAGRVRPLRHQGPRWRATSSPRPSRFTGCQTATTASSRARRRAGRRRRTWRRRWRRWSGLFVRGRTDPYAWRRACEHRASAASEVGNDRRIVYSRGFRVVSRRTGERVFRRQSKGLPFGRSLQAMGTNRNNRFQKPPFSSGNLRVVSGTIFTIRARKNPEKTLVFSGQMGGRGLEPLTSTV